MNLSIFTSYFLIIIILIILFCYYRNISRDVTLVKSDLDNQNYLVRNLSDKKDAANRLAFIRIKLAKVVDLVKPENNSLKKLYNTYIVGDKQLESGISFNLFEKSINQLINKFNNSSATFSETTPDAKYTSYSVNKGEELVFCLRLKKEGDRLVDKNIILFVALHELSHLMTLTIGHGPDFWNNFRFILKLAVKNNIYKSIDFNKYHKPYCGIKITDTPYHN